MSKDSIAEEAVNERKDQVQELLQDAAKDAETVNGMEAAVGETGKKRRKIRPWKTKPARRSRSSSTARRKRSSSGSGSARRA